MKKHTLWCITALCLSMAMDTNCWKTYEQINFDHKFLDLRKNIARTFYKCVLTKKQSDRNCLDQANTKLTKLYNQHNKEDEAYCDKIIVGFAPTNPIIGLHIQELIQSRQLTKCFAKFLKNKPSRHREYQNFFAALQVYIEKPDK